MLEIDARIPNIYRFLVDSETGILFEPTATNEEIVQSVPEGWGVLFRLPFRLTNTFDDLYVKALATSKGLLRMVAGGDEELADIFERVAQTIAAESSRICMVCGDRGKRRKTEKYSPCLCGDHYVQYLNWLEMPDGE